MKLSIITVCYNAAATIERTIRSVLGQQGDFEIEYIIIDGGSTDSTLDIVRRYEAGITYWVSEPDEGIFDAMNKGIRAASGDWIGIINSDDWYAKSAFQHVVTCIRQRKADVVVGGVMRVAEDLSYGKIILPPAGTFAVDQPNNHPATFVSKTVYEAVGAFNLAYRLASDLDFILRLQSSGQWAIVKLERVLSYMLEGGASRGFAGIREGAMVAWTYHGLPKAFRVSLRKYFQKTRRVLMDTLLPASLSAKLRVKWWRKQQAVRALAESEDLWMNAASVTV